MTIRLLIGLDKTEIDPDQLAALYRLLPAEQVCITADRDDMAAAAGSADIFAADVPLKTVLAAPNLRWFQQWGAGANWLMRYPQAIDMPFVLTNVSGIHAIPIAEHILALMLAFARNLPHAFQAQQAKNWQDSKTTPVFELAGKTVLLVGVGEIGRHVAWPLTALGMRVLGIRRNPNRAVPHVQQMHGPADLHALLPQADFVALAIPHTPATEGMFAAQEFELMKSSAIFINIGRGKTVNEPDLMAALSGGQIAAAGLDVFATEPLPPESPLWDMPNVIITGHYSGHTPHYNRRAMTIFLDNLARYLSNRPLTRVVDKKLGY